MTTAGGQSEIMIAEFDPWQHRKRITLSRAQVAAVLDLREDVHIIGMDVHRDPMCLDITVASARFPEVPEGHEQRISWGETRATEQGPRYVADERSDLQNEREPGWMEGWRLAIDWLRREHSDVLARIDLATEMETRLP